MALGHYNAIIRVLHFKKKNLSFTNWLAQLPSHCISNYRYLVFVEVYFMLKLTGGFCLAIRAFSLLFTIHEEFDLFRSEHTLLKELMY